MGRMEARERRRRGSEEKERERERKKGRRRRSAGMALYVSGGITAVDRERLPRSDSAQGIPVMAIM